MGPAPIERRRWTPPAVRRIEAGSAEGGDGWLGDGGHAAAGS